MRPRGSKRQTCRRVRTHACGHEYPPGSASTRPCAATGHAHLGRQLRHQLLVRAQLLGELLLRAHLRVARRSRAPAPRLARVLLRGARRSQPRVRAGGMRACAGEGSHLAERARLRLPHERRARIAADHAGGVIAAQRRDRARLGRRLGWLRDLPDARRASASVPGRRRARSAAHRLRARAGRRRAAIAAGIQHFGDQHRPRNRGIWVVSCFFLKGAKRHKKTSPLTAPCIAIFSFFSERVFVRQNTTPFC